MQIEFSNPEELAKFTEKLLTTVGHERYWTRRWMKNFGFNNRKYMDEWQSKIDTMIRELHINDAELNNNIKVKIKTPQE